VIVVIEVEFQDIIYVGSEETGEVEVTLVASGPSTRPFEVIVVLMESANLSAKGMY